VISTAWHDRVLVVTLDRPERRNAVDLAALEALLVALGEAREGEARVLVLTGAGGHFSAGADLKSLTDSSYATVLRSVLDGLTEASFPTMAAVEGAALGAGTQLATACDLRVATASARFGIPAAKLGLMVDAQTVQRVVSLVGHGPARAMLLAAEQIDGEAAHRLGLVQRLGSLDDAMAWAQEIAQLAPLSIAGHKLTLERLLPRPADDADVHAAFNRAWGSADLAEGRAAFAERRSPRFDGR
jgi:enoyl-CoA hydratase